MGDISWNVNVHDTKLLINGPIYVVGDSINLQNLVFDQASRLRIYLQPMRYVGRETNLSRLVAPRAEAYNHLVAVSNDVLGRPATYGSWIMIRTFFAS